MEHLDFRATATQPLPPTPQLAISADSVRNNAPLVTVNALLSTSHCLTHPNPLDLAALRAKVAAEGGLTAVQFQIEKPAGKKGGGKKPFNAGKKQAAAGSVSSP